MALLYAPSGTTVKNVIYCNTTIPAMYIKIRNRFRSLYCKLFCQLPWRTVLEKTAPFMAF
jgi:hypothetical protein